MPAAYSHYRLGKMVLAKLDDQLQNLIKNNLDYYNIGLHGPDILFYNRPYLHSRINRLGSKMHRKTARTFFEPAIKIIKDSKNEAQLAYLCGFICHFILDSNCHGFIDDIINRTKVTHFEIETELDRDFMIEDGLDPLRTHLTNHIKVNDEIVDNIAIFFNGASKKDIYKSLKGFKFYDRLLVAPQLYKRGLIYLVLKITFTFKRFQGFVVNYKPNSKITTDIKTLKQLFDHSIDESVTYIEQFITTIKNNEPLDNRFNRNYK
ncbi:zinc dependent phospholipase C family protein [uncultured Thomasclavelia sp.]|uniref:zinc dependent phospholipase C family protein n=1 Tax=uncultured Thomasclavelia sp. TaxID=3025759 RepID=UPI0026010EA2|nr:zinc dependent phospholipase C family protein [uncultured Thomasclavelia sp.]